MTGAAGWAGTAGRPFADRSVGDRHGTFRASGPGGGTATGARPPDSLLAHARPGDQRRSDPWPTGLPAASGQVSLLYAAAACLVVAQVLGIYGLVSRKADLVFSICMVALLVASVVLGVLGVRQQIG